MLVVVSDMHLTNRWFNPKKLRYLTNIIESADQVAITGDFWDGFRCSFDQFIKSPWRVLFPLLKSKEAIYIYGNHDPEEWCDWRVNLFSVYQAESVDLKVGTLNLHLEHGHRIAGDPLTKYPQLRNVPLLGHADYLLQNFIPTSLFGERWVKFMGRYPTNLMRERAEELSKSGQWLVCGHSHVAQLDPTIKYANCGFFGLGYAQYLRVDKHSIGLAKDRY